MAQRPRGGFTPDTFFFQPALPGEGLKTKIFFEAHITSLTDASSPDWSSHKDMGRADSTMMYSGVNRNISISFMVVSTGEREHRENYERLTKLGNMTYPIYKSGLGYNATHVFYQIGSHLSGYGIITSVDYAWNGETPWVNGRPVITEVGMGIKVLGDKTGKRPNYSNGNYDYFGGL